MKTTSLMLVVFMLFTSSLYAQTPGAGAPPEGLAKMKKFAALAGDWKGPGEYSMGGPAKQSAVSEHLYTKLDGLVLMMEGLGKTKDAATGVDKITHNALGALSWDENTKEYRLCTWLSDGKSVVAYWKVTDDTHFEWGFPLGENQGNIRYSVTLNAEGTTWKEIGEYSRSGAEWNKFFEMNLTKVK